jgi:deoxyribodipyrimidine photo-lyase
MQHLQGIPRGGAVRPIIIWFRQDLRVTDHAPLAAAARAPVVPLYVLDDALAGDRAPGGASRWWLHSSLESLSRTLASLGAPLVLRRGDTRSTIVALARETDAQGVYWSRGYEPGIAQAETALQRELEANGVEARRFAGTLLVEPEHLRTGQGGPYKVYTPFAKALQGALTPRAPVAAPARLEPGASAPSSERLDDWNLLPRQPDWAQGLRASWTPGEAGAAERLARFVDSSLGAYEELRNRPDLEGTSRLSPHLHFGELGVRQVWHAVQAARAIARDERGALAFQRELAWREFSYHLLHHFPRLPDEPMRAEFASFPWRADPQALRAWQRGRTGYPIVDAGMRELWHTGWMHNRVRMIAASFLVKHLLLPWNAGERWFWDTLVDADLASNAVNWQWVAGCGTDAAQYVRIFNPVLQGRRFDPEGAYVRRWIPELHALPADHIHAPWLAPTDTLARSGVRLGRDYPAPVVDHAAARARALAAWSRLRQG